MLTEEQLQALIDRQLEIERKARAWDIWRDNVRNGAAYTTWMGVPLDAYLDALENVVHPAQAAADVTAKGA